MVREGSLFVLLLKEFVEIFFASKYIVNYSECLMGSGKEYCHRLHFSGKPTLRWRFACRKFVGEWLQGSLLWGSEENRIRQRERLKFNAVTAVAPDHPTRSSGASELSSVEAKGSDLYLSKLTSHWTYAIPGKGACPWADDFL